MRTTMLLINHDDNDVSADRLADTLLDVEGVTNVDVFSSVNDDTDDGEDPEAPLCGCGARHWVHSD